MDINSNPASPISNQPQLETGKIPPKRMRPVARRLMPFGRLLNAALEFISRTNLFVLCCIAACLSLISYLAAFSCEISWILEAHGNLPTTSYLLCSGYFILFVASTILIHGLATGLPWGLFSWSVIIGVLSIPELALVMMITTQFWGLQSTHGLTELISYIIRLIINCLALLCVLPTALRWRREQQVLEQLQGLASRLQLHQTTPPGGVVGGKPNNHHNNKSMMLGDIESQQHQMQQHQLIQNTQQEQQQQQQFSRQNSRANTKKNMRRRHSGIENAAFIVHESQLPFPYSYGVYGSQNEFNASVFGLNGDAQHAPYVGSMSHINPSRTRSLLDLRNVIMPMHMMVDATAQNVHSANHKNNTTKTTIPDQTSEAGEPMYYTIGSVKDAPSNPGGSKSLPPSVPLMRNCVSMENLGSGGIQMLNAADANAMAAIAADEMHRRNALMMQQHPHSPNYNPAAAAISAQETAAAAAARATTADNHQQDNTQKNNASSSSRLRSNFLAHQYHSAAQQHQQQQQYPFGVYQQWSQPGVFAGNGANNSNKNNGALWSPNHWHQWPTSGRYAQAPAPFVAWGTNDARRFMHPYLQQPQQSPYHPHLQLHQRQPPPPHHYNSRSTMNSKQSLGSDDFRKYRDVAL